MAERKVVAAEDDVREIEVKVGSSYTRTLTSEDTDVFAKSIEELRGYDGLSAVFKRRTTREIEKFHRGTGGAKSKKIETDEISGYNAFEVVMPPYNLDYLAKLYEISAPHQASVDAKVANIVGLGYDFEITDKVKLKLETVESEKKTQTLRRKFAAAKIQLQEWLTSCNEEDDFLEVLAKVWTDLETTGNGYLEVGRKNTGEVGYIGHVPSPTVRIRKKRDGFIQLISNRAIFFRNYGDKKTANPVGGDSTPNEIIHLKIYSPTNGFYGIPNIIAAKTAIAGNEFSARYNLDYFENKAVPRYVIVVKGGVLSAKSEQQLLEFFQTDIKGKNHRTLYVPLPAEDVDKKVDFKMEPIEAGIQDGSFNNYRRGNLNEILMAHRVPITKVGLAEGASLAVARDADKTFKEQVCRPAQRVLENKLNKILHEVTDVFDLRLNQLTLTDEDTQSKIDERFLRMQVIVPNEVRARMGLPGIEGGDKVVDLQAQAAEIKAQAMDSRQRDQQRTANSTDSASSTNTRAPKGEGRQQA